MREEYTQSKKPPRYNQVKLYQNIISFYLRVMWWQVVIFNLFFYDYCYFLHFHSSTEV